MPADWFHWKPYSKGLFCKYRLDFTQASFMIAKMFIRMLLSLSFLFIRTQEPS